MKTEVTVTTKQTRPTAISGTFKRDLFNDIKKTHKNKSNKTMKNLTMSQETLNKEVYDEVKTPEEPNLKMNEESSYEMSSVGEKSSKGKHQSNQDDKDSDSSEGSEDSKKWN